MPLRVLLDESVPRALGPALAADGHDVADSRDVGLQRRTQNLVDFHDDPTARVLFCTDAGGVGLNLQRAANACINVELPWNPAVLEQRIGRIHRLGQESPIDVFHLVTEGGIESRIADLVADKRAVFTGLFDGTSDAVAFDRSGSFLQRVEQLVEATSPVPMPAPAEDDDDVDVGDDDARAVVVGSVAVADAAAASPSPPQVDVASLLARVQIATTPDGSLTITAPPDASRALASLLAGVARLLDGAADGRGDAVP